MSSIKDSQRKAIGYTILAIATFSLGLTNTCVGCSNIGNSFSSDSESNSKPQRSSSSLSNSATTAYSTTRNLTGSSSTPISSVTSTTPISTSQPEIWESEEPNYLDSYDSSFDNSNSDIYFSSEEYWGYDTYEQYTEESPYYITSAFDMILQPVHIAIDMFGDNYIVDTKSNGEPVLIYGDYDLLVWYNFDDIITGLRLTQNNPYMNSVDGYEYTSSMTMNEINNLIGEDVVQFDDDGECFISLFGTNEYGYELSVYYSFSSDDLNTPSDCVEVCLYQ